MISNSLHYALITALLINSPSAKGQDTAESETAKNMTASNQQLSADNQRNSLEEIIVTARKREERLRDIPISADAISGAEIEANGIVSVNNLFGKVPSLYFSSNLLSPGRDFVNLVIRGIGAQGGGEPAVATVVDGVYSPSLGFDLQFLDLERVEVLRGPQGTLFGRNTEGGALNIVSRRPDNVGRGRVAFTYDEFETIGAQGAVSGPLSETVFAGIAVDYRTTNGYLTNPTLGEQLLEQTGTNVVVPADDWRKYAGRFTFRWMPSSDTDIFLTADVSNRKGNDGLPGVPRGCNCYNVFSEFQLDAEYENAGVALNIDHTFSWGHLTSITGYRDLESRLPFDFDGGSDFADNTQDLRTFQKIISEEVRLDDGGRTDNLQWLIGVYAFSEENLQRRRFLFETTPQVTGIDVDAQDQDIDREGYAIFGQLSYPFWEKLDVTIGGRYSTEEIDSRLDVDFIIPNFFGPGLPLAIVETDNRSDSFDDFSLTASLAYSWTSDVMTYFTYSEGYKAGGFPKAPATSTTNIAFDEETSENLEFGAKATLLDDRLSVSGALYRTTIENQQLSTVVFLNGDPNAPVAAVGNAGESTSEGFEFSLSALVTPNFRLDGNVGVVDAKYDIYTDTIGADRSGERFPFVPEITYQLSGEYTWDIGDFDLSVWGSYRYVDEILSGSGVDIDFQFAVDSYDLFDFRATLTRNSWELTAFVDNAMDEYVESRVWNTFFFPFPPGRANSILLPPRRIGLRFTIEF